MRAVVDIETDSLDATKIHCIVAKDVDSGRVYPTLLNFLKINELFI